MRRDEIDARLEREAEIAAERLRRRGHFGQADALLRFMSPRAGRPDDAGILAARRALRLLVREVVDRADREEVLGSMIEDLKGEVCEWSRMWREAKGRAPEVG